MTVKRPKGHVPYLLIPFLTTRAGSGQSLPAGRSKLDKIVTVVVAVAWFAFVSYLVPRHEPWADEAQAWQLAKYTSLGELFGHFLHYELSPGLWHFLLWNVARLHVSYVGMHWLSAIIALTGIVLLLHLSPFPLLLRIGLAFSYFFAYQYAVVARSYVLIAPLLFTLAIIWPKRQTRPFTIAILLGLLANTAAHGLMVACGLGSILLLEYWKSGRQLHVTKVRWVLAECLLLISICFALWCLSLPHDAVFRSNLKAGAASLDASTLLHFFYNKKHQWMGHLPRSVEVALRALLWARGRLTWAFGPEAAFGDAVWLAFTIVCWRRRKLFYLLPPAMLTLFICFTTYNFYHAGLFWTLFVFLWWVTWDEVSASAWNLALLVAVYVCVCYQVRWAANAARYDILHTYSPHRDAATVLARYLEAGKQVDVAVPARTPAREHGEYYSIGMEPYFAGEPFHNMRARFWIWKDDTDMRDTYLQDAKNHSTVVLLEDAGDDARAVREASWLESQGYAKSAVVCGRAYSPVNLMQPPLLCHTFYETRPASTRPQ